MTRIIGLTGPARSGKSIVASTLAELDFGEVEIVGFADLLKLSAARSLSVTFGPDDVGTMAVRKWANDFKKNKRIQIVDEGGEVTHEISGRRFLQCYGTEAHRDTFGTDFWVEQIDFEPEGVDLLIFDDVRFPNEAEAILSRGGVIWRVIRDTGASDSHRSEQPLPDSLVTGAVLNDGTIDELKNRVRAAYVMGEAA